MESLNNAQDFHQNHLMVLRKTASREYPKTHLPARDQRDVPKGPISKMSLFHYTVCKFTSQKSKKGVSRGGPRRWILKVCWCKKRKETIATQQKPAFHENKCFPTFFNYLLNTNVDNRNQTLGNTPVSETPQSINIV